ncbi:MAG: hypothetical protein M3Z08_10875 [Chloroflexota bacterium]|nr:hypothetical protein [Chloroflexota bacterium]
MACHGDNGGPNPTWVSYCPSTTLEVPPNSIITVVIKNYDTPTPLHNTFFRQVRGTIGGIEMVNNKPMSQLDASLVSHTFTLQSKPESPNPLFVSVPVAATPNNAPTPVTINGNSYANPMVISFQFRTEANGSYIWHCYDPCGSGLQDFNQGFGGPMSTTGYMAGTMTVTNY